MSVVKSNEGRPSRPNRLRSFIGNKLVARSRSYRAALAELAELRRAAAEMSEKLRHLEAAQERSEPRREAAPHESSANPASNAPGRAGPRLPSIFLAAIPKSAGSYINNTLLRGLHFDHYDLTINLFPYDLIVWDRWAAFCEGNKVAHHHIEASAPNLWYMRTFALKLVVHVRDPRAVLLSWIHHLSSNTRAAELLPHPVLAPPDEYYAKPLPWKIDWMIDHHLQVFTRWIEDWLDAEPAHAETLLFTQYEDFVRDGAGFVNKILDFYGIPRSRFLDPALPLAREFNFRKGQVEEWRDVFDEQQRRKASSAVPAGLYERFGWNADADRMQNGRDSQAGA